MSVKSSACPVALRQRVSESSLHYGELDVLSGLAEEYGRNRNTIRMWLRDLETRGFKVVRPYYNGKKRLIKSTSMNKAQELAAKLPKKELFELAWDEYREIIGMSAKHKPPKAPEKNRGNHRKICVISDTHGNAYKPGIDKMLGESPDLVLIVGDVMDCFSVSRFFKDRYIPIEQEMANTRALLERIAGVCSLKVSKGNHDHRFRSYISSHLDSQYLRFVETDILKFTATGIENCEIVDNPHSFTTAAGDKIENILRDSFIITVGNAVFTHAEVARKGELNTARAVYEWYSMWQKVLGWIQPVLIGQAHTHRAGIGFPNGGHVVVMELGAMLNPSTIQYALDGETKWVPPTIGYSVIEQDLVGKQWKTDLSSVRFVLC